MLLLDDELLQSGEPPFDVVDTKADDPAQLYYSSGTTGLAKGIVHAHRYLLAHEEFVYCHDVRDGERFHGMGEWAWAAGIAPLLGPWRYGAVQLVLQRKGGFDPHKQLDFLSRHEASNVFTTPTAMRSMMSIENAGERYPQKFRIVCSAGEPLNPEAIRWFREQYGLTVLDYYGLTESYPLVANYPFMDVREGSMGKPMPGWDVQILDEDEKPLPQGERGEICLRARSNPHYPIGYWNNPEDSEETFGGDWFHTKDAASLDEDGYVWYEGRADDVIIAAGYRIGPFEVESALLEHACVAEAAAVASPDERRGNVVKAFIVLAEGKEGSDELVDEIKAFVRDRLSAYAYPRKIEFVDELPKTLTGKIRRIELRQAEMEAAKRSSIAGGSVREGVRELRPGRTKPAPFAQCKEVRRSPVWAHVAERPKGRHHADPRLVRRRRPDRRPPRRCPHHPRRPPRPPASPATDGDRLVLRRAAAGDGPRCPPRPARQRARPSSDMLVAEIDERIVAAVPFDGGRAIADPFLPTADIVELLRARVELATPVAGRPRAPLPPAARSRRLSGASARPPAAPAGYSERGHADDEQHPDRAHRRARRARGRAARRRRRPASLAFVAGESGVGKSRLVAELARRSARGRCPRRDRRMRRARRRGAALRPDRQRPPLARPRPRPRPR